MDGDVRGALRLICSDDVIAPYKEWTLIALIKKHPPPAEEPKFPVFADEVDRITPVDNEVKSSILSFRNVNSGGLGSLRPQILKEFLNVRIGDAAS